jgi:hypothetical protein
LLQLTASERCARVMPTYISRRSSCSRCTNDSLCHGAVRVFRLEGQHAFDAAGQHHVRPLQALGRVQRRQRHHVLVLLALADGRQQRDRLRHFQQVLLLGWPGARRRSSISPPQRLAIQSMKSSTLVQRAAATFSLSSPSYRCFS